MARVVQEGSGTSELSYSISLNLLGFCLFWATCASLLQYNMTLATQASVGMFCHHAERSWCVEYKSRANNCIGVSQARWRNNIIYNAASRSTLALYQLATEYHNITLFVIITMNSVTPL